MGPSLRSSALLPLDDVELLGLAQPGGPEPGARGLFLDEGWLRRVSGAPVTIFGGGRALLLEVAHPFVAAGVAEHSAYLGSQHLGPTYRAVGGPI